MINLLLITGMKELRKFNRDNNLGLLKNTKVFDVIIIGGGATGLGCALDASSRGFSVALFEKHDFCKGTSSRSTKLIHGGIRYLEKLHFSLVYESLKERDLLIKNASHIVKQIGFIIPVYKYWSMFYYWIGLKLYDLISGNYIFSKSKIIDSKTALDYIPNLNKNKLKGGVIYFDGQFNDSRLGIDLAITSLEFNSVMLNYMSVDNFLKENNKISGVKVFDSIGDKYYNIKAKSVINCTGVFSQSIINLDSIQQESLIKPSQGIHLIIDKKFLNGDFGFLVPNTSDGRVLFAIPWLNHVILGTTDREVENPVFDPVAKEEEVEYILKNAKQFFNIKPKRSDIKTVFAGLRPLVSNSKKLKSKDLSRKHKIVISESGLISVIGGKWTTYRKIAEDTIDFLISKFNLKTIESPTKKIKIINGLKHIDFSEKSLSEKFYISKSLIIHFVKNEMAINIDDIMSRRTRCLFLDVEESIKIAPIVVEIMANELLKDKIWENKQLKSFYKLTNLYKI